MIGFFVLFAFAIYLLLSAWVVFAVARRAEKNDRNKWLWGGVAGFVMYNLVFWDVIPTILLHKHYCATKAGTWTYKTLDQWKVENPGIADTLTWQEGSKTFYAEGIDYGMILNERFNWERKVERTLAVPVRTTTESIVDTQSKQVVAKHVKIWSGYRSGDGWSTLKKWVGLEACPSDLTEFVNITHAFHEIGRKVNDDRNEELSEHGVSGPGELRLLR